MDKKELKERLNNIAKELQVIFKIIEEAEPVFPVAKLIDVENKKCLECGLQIEGKIVRGLHESCRKSLKKRLLEAPFSVRQSQRGDRRLTSKHTRWLDFQEANVLPQENDMYPFSFH